TIVLIGILATFIVSKFLSKTILKGKPSSFILELPPYRKPQILKTLVRSFKDKTVFVLWRAVIVAIPAGLIIWLMANIDINGLPVLIHMTSFLDPFAKLMGIDGHILTAFILGFPANEIVIPIIIMSYTQGGVLTEFSTLAELSNLLTLNGWTIFTGISVLIFTLFHFPCATTCLTIKKETVSFKWTIIAFILPTIMGIGLCMGFTAIVNILF
ncbi:MAG: ferrous iron transporter B, partial [Firmicutes bacterium]|nr:ferrous iron transporter B [Bacillota bacterium]